MRPPLCRICYHRHYGIDHYSTASNKPLKKQRWDRDKYNAYMREYMREKRKQSSNT